MVVEIWSWRIEKRIGGVGFVEKVGIVGSFVWSFKNECKRGV